MVDSRTTDASAMPGNTSQPTPTPAIMVRGSPMSSSRLGQPSSRRSERRSRRAASLNSSSTSAISVTRSATADSTETSSQPSAEAPTTKPAAVKNSAEVIPRRSSGAENALQTMMITTMVAAATMRVPAFRSLHRPPSGGPRAILQPPRRDNDERPAAAPERG